MGLYAFPRLRWAKISVFRCIRISSTYPRHVPRLTLGSRLGTLTTPNLIRWLVRRLVTNTFTFALCLCLWFLMERLLTMRWKVWPGTRLTHLLGITSLFFLAAMFWWDLSDQNSKGSLVLHCLLWVYCGWHLDWQVIPGMAGVSNCYLNHDPPHRRPRLPRCDCLSSKGLQHRPLSWPHKGLQWFPSW